MARYENDEQLQADGLSIEHQPERHRFAVMRGDRGVGEAHYTLIDDGEQAAVDFDHTFVAPEYRGTGLSELLARHALTDEIANRRRVLASCWFIAGYLGRHPELRGEG